MSPSVSCSDLLRPVTSSKLSLVVALHRTVSPSQPSPPHRSARRVGEPAAARGESKKVSVAHGYASARLGPERSTFWLASPTALRGERRNTRRPTRTRSCGPRGRGCRRPRQKAGQTAQIFSRRRGESASAKRGGPPPPPSGAGVRYKRATTKGVGGDTDLGHDTSGSDGDAPADGDVRQDGHVPAEPAIVADLDRSAALGAGGPVPYCRVERVSAGKAGAKQKRKNTLATTPDRQVSRVRGSCSETKDVTGK